MTIAFIDLQAQRHRIADRIDAALGAAVREGNYIMGPQVKAAEAALAAFSGAARCVSCGNGTDALALPLMAWGVGAGDAVFCPSFTFAATAEIVPWTAAEPVFVDILPDTLNIDPAHLEASIQQVIAEGRLKPRAIIAVCLFGQPANYPAIAEIARKYDLKLIADAAQGFGGTIDGRHASDWADAVTTSFFPAKPLGCYGDGGAVLTNDADLAVLMDSLRVHGKATAADIAGQTFDHDPKYMNVRVGMNSRLDTLQAAILLEKLAIFPDEIEARNRIAKRYNQALAPHVAAVPTVADGFVSTWAQYTIEHPQRDALAAHLKTLGVPTAVYYPIPMHRQIAYSAYGSGPGGLPVTDAKSSTVISLPMHPYLDEATQDRIIDGVRSFGG